MPGTALQPHLKTPPGAGTKTIVVDSEHAGRRLDKFLRARFKHVPAGQLFKLLRTGRLRINGRKIDQTYRLAEGDTIQMPVLDAAADAARPANVPVGLLKRLKNSVLHEDADLLVVDKPAGVAVHRGTDVETGVIEAFRQLRPELPQLELSHRLDRDTSGVLVLAKTPSMLRYLHDLLREREDEIERHYLAIVAGTWGGETAIHEPLLRREDKVVVAPAGQRAETRVKVERRIGRSATLLRVQLLTGRKHQIRVHLQHAGHPIAGDDRYGSRAFNRKVAESGGNGLYLHAATMVIPKPDGSQLAIDAPTPQRWQRLLASGL